MGLFYLQLVFSVALAGSLQYVFSKIAKDWFIGALLGVYVATSCFDHFTLRPQVLVWIFFAFLLMTVDRIATSGLSRGRGSAIALLGSLWANTHLTSALGLGALFLWLLPADRSPTAWKLLLSTCVLFFVGTLVTPYLGGEWITFFAKSGHPLKYSAIAEFQPATILQYSTVFMLLALVSLVVAAFTSRTVPSVGRSILAGGMVMAGLTAVKFLPFASIVLGALFCVWWRDVACRTTAVPEPGLFEALRRLRDWCSGLSDQTLGACGFVACSIAVVNLSQLVKEPLNLSYVPKGVVDFVEQHSLSHPVLNEFGAGGYLMYRFSDRAGIPSHLVAIDGRTNINPPEVWQMYQESLLGKAGWHRFLDKVQPQTIIWRQGSALVSLLFATKQWCRVYASGARESDYVMFIKKEEFLRRRTEFTSNNCMVESTSVVVADSPPT